MIQAIDRSLFLIGFMGTGKSSVSAALGDMLEQEVMEMDACIARREGTSISEIFAQKGEEYFRRCETKLLRDCAGWEPLIVSCGGGVPMRQENVDAMRACGKIILLTARPETILERLKDDHSRPLLEGHKNVAYVTALMMQRQPKYAAAADITVDTSDRSVEAICYEILAQCANQ